MLNWKSLRHGAVSRLIGKRTNHAAGTTNQLNSKFIPFIITGAAIKTWKQALADGVLSGCIASVITTIVLAARGAKESPSPFAPVNAISHWLWGEHAVHRDDLNTKYTVTGYTIHHASATLWAILYERWFGDKSDRKEIVPAMAGGVAVAALACFTDYKLTPYRFHPGYERRLSTSSLFFVYGVGAIAFTLRGLMSDMRNRDPVCSSTRHGE